MTSALAVQRNGPDALCILAGHGFRELQNLLAVYHRTLVTIDSVAGSSIAAQFQSELCELTDTVRRLADNDLASRSECHAATSEFKTRFADTSIFIRALVHLQKNTELLRSEQVQIALFLVSKTRRRIWRIAEHLWHLSAPKWRRPYGIISNTESIDSLLRRALVDETRRFPWHCRSSQITFDCHTAVFSYVDDVRFVNAFRELIRNAVFSTLIPVGRNRFTPVRHKSAVFISIVSDDKQAIIDLRDNGVGMDDSAIESIHLFGYSKNSRGVHIGGPGIGFPTARQSIIEHNGAVGVPPIYVPITDSVVGEFLRCAEVCGA